MSAPAPPGPVWDVVIPTVGRPSLGRLLAALDDAGEHGLRRIVIADDRATDERTPLLDGRAVPAALAARIDVHRSDGRGPAAARNLGWRAAAAPWIAFLDDDVVPPAGWAAALADDLRDRPDDVAGVQARLVVPRPLARPPTDQERSDAALVDARWATADMAYRRSALAAAHGFDERFPRAYREDAELALRLRRAGWRLEVGRRRCVHPTRDARWHASIGRQRGNADDALMRALHGRRWREAGAVPRGSRAGHLATVAAGIAGGAALATGRRGLAGPLLAGWAIGTGVFAARRIATGPRTPAELTTMLVTSIAIPPAAVGHWVRGWLRVARLPDRRPLPTAGPPAARSVDAVLLDRDGTLLIDVPYNGHPDRVVLVPGARRAIDRLRRTGVAVGLISNQSGIARGLVTTAQVEAVNARVAELVGPLDPILYCPHGPEDGCACRKPRPGMVLDAARRLDVAPERCAVIGDIGADVEAAAAAGARGILVPTPATRRAEVGDAREVAVDLAGAVDLLLGERAVVA